MRQIIKLCKFLKSIEDGVVGRSIGRKVKLLWVILYFFFYLDRVVCRKNGYIWLGDLFIFEISEESGGDLLTNISSLKK